MRIKRLRLKRLYKVQTYALCLLGIWTYAFSKSFAQDISNVDLSLKEEEIEIEPILWEYFAANDALKMGFTSLAENIYSQLLLNHHLELSLKESIQLKLISVLISQERFEQAQAILDSIEVSRNADYYLRSALLAFHFENWIQLDRDLKCIDLTSLPEEDLPWFYVLNGLWAQAYGEYETAKDFFEKAENASYSGTQKAELESIILRERIFSGQVSEALAEELKEKTKTYETQNIGRQFAKEYAMVLNQLDKKDEALAVIDDQWKYLEQESKDQFDEFLLLSAIIAGENSIRGQRALKELLQEEGALDLRRKALHLFMRSELTVKTPGAYRTFLDGLMARDDMVSLLDELYLLHAQLDFLEGNLNEAGKNAEYLLEHFPASPLRTSALRILADVAWNKNPPQYRLAAEYLTQLRLYEKNEFERSQLSVLIADSYFLNKDYKTASKIYGEVLNSYSKTIQLGAVLYQQVQSDIAAKDFNLAERHLRESRGLQRIHDSYRWRATWNLIYALRKAGEIQSALQQLVYLENESKGQRAASDLQLRLNWMKAQLLFDLGEEMKVLAVLEDMKAMLLGSNEIDPLKDSHNRIDSRIKRDKPYSDGGIRVQSRRIIDSTNHEEINVRINQGDPLQTALDKNPQNIILSHILLLESQVYFELGREDEGVAILNRIRTEYPESDALLLSYIEEARYYASKDSIAEAQRLLLELADKYRDSAYAPIALYEAALLSERAGLNRNIEQAIALLERLSSEYPNDKDVPIFYVRLKQGDLLRKLNNFTAAQRVYENIIHEYRKHPESYLADFGKAKALFAQGKDASLEEAEMSFERLFDLKHLPVSFRVESGFLWAETLIKQERYQDAEKAYWRAISQFLLDPEFSDKLGASGRYWMSRSLFELGALFERANDTNQANRIYNLVLQYKLPGQNLARNKLKKIS